MRLYSNDENNGYSAAVYGQKEEVISVGDLLNPLSPYGNSKKWNLIWILCKTL